MRTPLKTEFGLAAAEAKRGSVKPVAAATAVPRNLRRVSGLDFMGRLEGVELLLLPESNRNQ